MDAVDYIDAVIVQIEQDEINPDDIRTTLENHFKGLVVVPKSEYEELQQLGWMYEELG